MNAYVVLLRGINVGGKNRLPMADLKAHLADLGYEQISTLLASGNVVLAADKSPNEITSEIEVSLPSKFRFDDELIRILVLPRKVFRAMIKNRPKGFGEQPDTYHSDAIFLMGIEAEEAMPVFRPREGVDKVWPGSGVIYSQRLSALRTKSRLNTIVMSPLYKSMTIRSWGTTLKILELVNQVET